MKGVNSLSRNIYTPQSTLTHYFSVCLGFIELCYEPVHMWGRLLGTLPINIPAYKHSPREGTLVGSTMENMALVGFALLLNSLRLAKNH